MGQTWEADKMLDVYIYDYLVKRNLQATAKAFMAEGKVANGPVAIDAPGGFLFEWWSVFWDIFIARTNENHSEAAAAYFEVQQMKNKEHLVVQYQLMQQRQAALQQQLRNANRPAPNGAISDGMLGSAAASSMAANVYGEQLKNPNSINSEAIKSISNHPGQLVQGHAGNMSSVLQQIQGRNLQSTDIRPVPGVSPRSLPGDTSTLYGQRVGQGKTGYSGGAGASGSAMLDGWPLTNEQLRSNLGPQVQRPFYPSSNQYQLSSAEQQLLLSQTHVQGNIGNSLGFGGLDPQRIRAMQRAGLTMKDGQPNANEGQNNRKRKPSSSGAGNSSSSQPSTPSTNTQGGDGVATGGPRAYDDLENLGDIGTLDDSFFAQDSPGENNGNGSKEHGGEQNN